MSIIFASTAAPTVRTNYVKNPSFSYGASYWSGDNFSVFEGIAQAYSMTAGAAGITSDVINVGTGSYWVRARVGATFSGRSTMPVHLRVRRYNAAGTLLGTDVTTVNVTNSPSARTTHDLIRNATALGTGVTRVELRIELDASAHEWAFLYVDDVLFEYGTTSRIDYFDGDTPSSGATVYAWSTPIPGISSSTRTTYAEGIAPTAVTDWSAESASRDVILEPVGAAYPIFVKTYTSVPPRTGRITAMFNTPSQAARLFTRARSGVDFVMIDTEDADRSIQMRATRVSHTALPGYSKDLREVSFDYVQTGAV